MLISGDKPFAQDKNIKGIVHLKFSFCNKLEIIQLINIYTVEELIILIPCL